MPAIASAAESWIGEAAACKVERVRWGRPLGPLSFATASSEAADALQFLPRIPAAVASAAADATDAAATAAAATAVGGAFPLATTHPHSHVSTKLPVSSYNSRGALNLFTRSRLLLFLGRFPSQIEV